MIMRKNSIKTNLTEIRQLVRKSPKTVKESMEFENEPISLDDEPEDLEDMPHSEPMMRKDEKMSPEDLINDIRKKSLRAMAELADTPEDPSYENLKRIWQLCDKAVNEKQDQREMAAKNPNIMRNA